MPPAFSAEERARITELLLDNGRALFTTRGLRKTSLEELVAPARIAKSSFYQFFDSKEALYLELMIRQTAEVKRRVIDEALYAEDDTRQALRRFLHATVTEITTDPLYRRLMTHPEEMRAVARRIDPSRMAALADNPVTALDDYIAREQRGGRLVDADPAVVVGLLQIVLLTPVHAEHLRDPDRYPEILDLLIDIVATALTTPEE
ncbi:TetR/AcrR family transcriptional regulator [Thermobifida halotolerans]|uniref:TetR/AcrR family transcriptional regulator n=1 Tax=Thermobifida halotolerans TaxID=483545 RepID=A0AA97M545_9ACTN|nr:TetR/AcrR family transcriptional regulator [Thermobifida halotolerans]UOE20627.1 TetR/AcrR family transcriptional regulator [Thermobifida halotolerans]